MRTPSGSIKDFTTPPRDSGVLKVGAKEEKITQIQRRLNSLYGEVVNGYFDDTTETRVKTFQSSKGLDADGIVGSATWSHLFPLLKEGWVGKDDIRSLQSLLNRFSYSQCGTPDGIFGPDTTKAVIAFQKNNSLSDDGVVGSDTWAVYVKAELF